MKKNIFMICLLLPSASFAELEQRNPITIRSSSQKVQESLITQPSIVQERRLDKNKPFRCWQDGELIIAESNWNQIPELGAFVMTKGRQRMKVYEFGDTFCLYLGG